MIRPLRKRHGRMVIILALVLVIVVLWAVSLKPDWPQKSPPDPPAISTVPR